MYLFAHLPLIFWYLRTPAKSKRLQVYFPYIVPGLKVCIK